MKCTWFVVFCAIGIALCINHDFKGFDDSILFAINWPGANYEFENIVDGKIFRPQYVSTDCQQQ